MGAREGSGPPATRDKDTRRLGQVDLRYTVTGALAFGFTLGLVVTYGLAHGRLRAVPSRLSFSKTTASMTFDFQRPEGSQMPSSSGMRLASLEMPVSGFQTDDVDPSALARPPSSFGDRLLPVERPDSFDQRFEGLAVWATTPAVIGGRGASAGTARQPLRERPFASVLGQPHGGLRYCCAHGVHAKWAQVGGPFRPRQPDGRPQSHQRQGPGADAAKRI
jgi:hypothetical protein